MMMILKKRRLCMYKSGEKEREKRKVVTYAPSYSLGGLMVVRSG